MTTRPPVRRGTPLTTREVEVLRLVAAGLTEREMAARLYVTVDTIKTFRRKIFQRLDARNMAHAVSLGYLRRLLP